MDAYWLSAFSDWLINISAGWFAAAFVIPATGKRSPKVNLVLLTLNTLFAILSLVGAVSLRRLLGVL